MLLNDPLENRRIAGGIPNALRIHDGDGSAFADAEAVRLCAQDAALLRQPELFQPALQEIPRREAPTLVAALRVRLIAAEKNVTPRDRDADGRRNGALRLRCRTHSGPIRYPAHP